MTKRADKRKNIDKIVAAKAKNPLASVREIAEETGISKTTVADHIKSDKVGQEGSRDERIVNLIEKDLEIIILWQKEIARRLKDPEELAKIRTGEISQVIKENTARYTLFKWDATDDEGWMKAWVVFLPPKE